MNLESFTKALDSWTERLLRPYLDGLADLGEASRTRPKEFNDGVWSTVALNPLEVLVLDSPLLQRLRHIRQLGVVHLVYPSATHTRIDHSIGTVHQVTRLVNRLNEGQVVVEPDMLNLLRLQRSSTTSGTG